MSKEDVEAGRIRAEREADARRDAWISCGDHDAGMSRDAACAAGTEPRSTEVTEAARRRAALDKAVAHTRRLDPPLESDPVGNAIPGLLAGGIVAGLEAGAAEAGLGSVLSSVGKHSAEHVAADLLEHGAHAAPGLAKTGPADVGEKQAATTKPPAAPAHTNEAAGRSGAKATSEAAPEPNKSEIPAAVGQDRAPYAPGKAPIRIPEAPMIIRG